MPTTIQISDELYQVLKEMKVHPREPFDDVIKRYLNKQLIYELKRIKNAKKMQDVQQPN